MNHESRTTNSEPLLAVTLTIGTWVGMYCIDQSRQELLQTHKTQWQMPTLQYLKLVTTPYDGRVQHALPLNARHS
jgi:hypothetical protein